MTDIPSARIIGSRVRAARESKGCTQDELAAHLQLENRQSVSDIETGNRAIKPDELVILSDVLERDLDYFVEPFSVAGEAKFNWRVSPTVPGDALNEFEERSSRLVGLLRWLREQQNSSTSALKKNLRLSLHSTFEVAQARAEQLGAELELGPEPGYTLLEKIERMLDIPVLMVDSDVFADGSISGATCHLDEMSCILINRKEGEARRAYNLAHELFHALTWEAMEPDRRESNTIEDRNSVGRKRIEQLANNFAAALLMPRASIHQFVNQGNRSDVAHLREVASALSVSYQALAWRLSNMNVIDDKTFKQLSHSHQSIVAFATPKLYSPNFMRMLHEAIDKGRVSARKIAKTLRLNLDQLGNVFAEHKMTVPFEL
jgi:Zn-dependent peptidase ImmA (M78 family)/transcriptional regulator with XRE-family HTH domain